MSKKAYTVKEISRLSGVSVRTLHYYDEMGLLKPAYLGESGYRFYFEEQLLLLQQILFFKELELDLKQIKKLMNQNQFDQAAALKSHKKTIKLNIQRMKKLINTIDKTVKHIKGEEKMSEFEIYAGFSREKQKEYESYIKEQYGPKSKALFDECKKNTSSWSSGDWKKYKSESETVNAELAKLLREKFAPSSEEVQKKIHAHYHLIKQMYLPSKEVYIGLGDLYKNHSDFNTYFSKFHPDLADFLSKAMKVYANRNL